MKEIGLIRRGSSLSWTVECFDAKECTIMNNEICGGTVSVERKNYAS